MTTRQQGSALVLSLIILLVMTMIGITALSTSTLEEKMAANDRNQRVAFQTAEAALAEGERVVASLNKDFFKEEGLKGKFEDEEQAGYIGIGNEEGALDSGWEPGVDCVAATVQSYNSTKPPCFKVEEIGFILPIEPQEYRPSQSMKQLSRITAYGADANDQTNVTVQSYHLLELFN